VSESVVFGSNGDTDGTGIDVCVVIPLIRVNQNYIPRLDSYVEGFAVVFALGWGQQMPRFAARYLSLPRGPLHVV